MRPSIENDQDAEHIIPSSSSPILPWCWILLCGTLSVIAFLAAGRTPGIFDADMGSETVLAKALIDSGHFFVSPDFFYSTEAQVVGHHLLLEIGIMLFPHDWMLARVFSLVAIMCGLVASFRFCAVSLDIWKRSRWVAGILLLPFSIIYRNFFLYGMFYSIRLCIYFVGFGLCIRCRTSRVPRAIMLISAAGLGFAFGISGFRMLLQCFLPLLIVFACTCIAEASGDTLKDRLRHVPQSDRRSLRLAGIMILSSVVGTLVNALVISKMVVFQHWGSISLQEIVPSRIIDFATAGFLQTWGNVGVEKAISTVGIASLCGIVTSLIVAASAIACIRRWSSITSAQRSYILFALLSFLVSLLMYYLGDQQRPRYLTPAVILFVLLVPLAIGFIRQDTLLRSLVAIVFACFVLVQTIGYAIWPAIAHIKSGEPFDEVKVVDWLREEGLSAGYATFWNCNNMVEISNGTLDIWCLVDGSWQYRGDWWSLEPLEWMAVRRHSEEEPQGRVFLLLTQEECDQAESAGIGMGEPATAIGDYRVFTYGSTHELRNACGVPE